MLRRFEPYQRYVARAVGLADEAHPGLLGRAIPLLLIAALARGDDILPCLLTAPAFGNDVIHSQLGGAEPHAAVLAGVLVSGVDQPPRQGESKIAGQFDIAAQADDQGPGQLRGCGADDLVRSFDDLRLVLEQEEDGPAGGDQMKRLVAGVEHQDFGIHTTPPEKQHAPDANVGRTERAARGGQRDLNP